MRGEISLMETRLLIASGSEEARSAVANTAAAAGFVSISVTGGAGLREKCGRGEADIAVIILPLENEFGLETALHISRMEKCGLLILAPGKVYEEVCAKGEGISAPILPRSAPGAIVANILKFLDRQRQKMQALYDENAALRESVNEMKLVSRAKCVLIEYLRISEQDAHRQLQKRAMDKRITLTDAAADVLKIYEYPKPLGSDL